MAEVVAATLGYVVAGYVVTGASVAGYVGYLVIRARRARSRAAAIAARPDRPS